MNTKHFSKAHLVLLLTIALVFVGAVVRAASCTPVEAQGLGFKSTSYLGQALACEFEKVRQTH